MIKRTLRRVILSLLAFCIVSSCGLSLAHRGRTDRRGGHRDNKNVSRLGAYHYHCNGKPPHLHKKGKCPYAKRPASRPKSNPKSKK